MKTLLSCATACAAVACSLLIGCSRSDHTPPADVAGVSPDGTMEMEFKWIVGNQYVLRMDLVSRSETDLPNQPKPMKQDTTMAQDYTVKVLKELPDGGRELALEITGTELEVKMGDRVMMSFNSTQDPSEDVGNPVAAMLRRTVGGQLKYETDSEGRVVSVNGFQPFIDRVMAGAPPAIRDSFGAMYSEGYFKQLCDAARMAPDRGVQPGDTWQRSIREEMGSLGTLAVYAKMKFKDWEQHGDRKCARIVSAGKLSSEPPSTDSDARTMAMEIQEGTVNSTGWFDPALGMVVESVADQNLTMKITTRGQTISSRMDQKINFKLQDVVAMTE